MDWYQEAKANSRSAAELIDLLYTKVATLLIEELDLTIAQPSLFKGNTQLAEQIYQWGHLIPGGKMSAEFGGMNHSAKIIRDKQKKGMI